MAYCWMLVSVREQVRMMNVLVVRMVEVMMCFVRYMRMVWSSISYMLVVVKISSEIVRIAGNYSEEEGRSVPE